MTDPTELPGKAKQVPPELKHQTPAIAYFLLEINDVCKKHGLSISHEDGHGAFEVINYSVRHRNWLWRALSSLKNPIQPTKELKKE